jgi:aspartate-semialdehyde dehydrogenase
LLENHPWFTVTALSASPRSAGKPYYETMQGRWKIEGDIPAAVRDIVVLDAADIEAVKPLVDFVFCAVDMKKDEIRALEEAYAKAEIPVISNNSAHRMTADVPMLLPELNPEHALIIPAQKKRLGTQRGFIAVKPNCSIQSYVPALHPLMDFGVEKVVACTYQAISGASKTFADWPEMVDNVIPYIGGDEDKAEQEPLTLWGNIQGDAIVPAKSPVISAQCIRVPVTDGHLAAVSVKFAKKPSAETIIQRWRAFEAEPQALKLPSAPSPFLTYFDEPNRPQTGVDRMIGGGMGISVGRLRDDPIFDYRFVCLSHNTIRGAAGGGVLMAEYLCAKGYI